MQLPTEQLSKESPEYRKNGVYIIGDKTFMSLWAFKSRRGDFMPTLNNLEHGRMLSRLGVPHISTTPDYGNYSKVFCYNADLLSELKFL